MDDTILTANPAGLCRKTRTLRRVFLFMDWEFVLEVLQVNSSKEVFVEHFRNQYGNDHPYMPVWVATEIMTFGHVLTMYQGAPNTIKKSIAAPLGIHDGVLGSWLLSLNTIRNICAHHSRLWNRKLGTDRKSTRLNSSHG